MASAMDHPNITIVIPTLNEKENIEPLLRRVFKSVDQIKPVEVIVVDDGSTDGTRECVKAWSAHHPVRLLSRDDERDLAGAVLAGAREAQCEVVVVMDADFSHPPKQIAALTQPILAGTHDMAIGSRYTRGGRTVGWPLRRKLMSRAATVLAWPLGDGRDPMSGFFATTRERLIKLSKEAKGYKIGLEVMAQSHEDLRVLEVPIQFVERSRGQSKMSSSTVGIFIHRLFNLAGGSASMSPLGRFGLVGLVGVVADLLVFYGLWLAGFGLAISHMAGFGAAMCCNYALNARRSFAALYTSNGKGREQRYLLYITICLLALFLRGGVLAFLIEKGGWPVALAVMSAIGVSAIVYYLGCTFFVFTEHAIKENARLGWRIAAVCGIAYAFCLRLVYLGVVDLIPEEAYYWNYAQHLDIGYLDHPPMVAWLIAAGTGVFGHTEFGVRIGSFLCWVVTAIFGYGLAHHQFGKSSAIRVLLLLAVLPFFFIFGFFMTPDAPLTACWVGALYFFERVVFGKQKSAWVGLGVCIGLGMLSKYTIALLVPAGLVFLLLDRESRRWLVRPEPWLAGLIALVLFSPVIIWNAQNQWASFVFQGPRRLGSSTEFSLHILLLSAALLLTPSGLIAAVCALLPRASWWPEDEQEAAGFRRKWLFALVFTLLPLSVFVLFSLRHEPKINWTGPLWLAVLPLLSLNMTPVPGQKIKSLQRFGQRLWLPTVVVTLLLFGGVMHYLALGIPGVGHLPRMRLPVAWEEMGAAIEDIEDQVKRQTGKQPLVVGMDKYFTASQLAFYRLRSMGKEHEQPWEEAVLNTSGRHLFNASSLMYAYWLPKQDQVGRTVVMVGLQSKKLQDKGVQGYFRSLGPIEEASLIKHGQDAGRFYYRIGYGYHHAHHAGDPPLSLRASNLTWLRIR